MKILDVAETYAPLGGGVKSYMHHKFAAAQRLGHDLTVLAPGPRTQIEEREGGRIHWLKSPQLPFDKRYHLFVRPSPVLEAIGEHHPDLIEVSSPQASAWFLANRKMAAPKVFVFHTDMVAVHLETFLGRSLGFGRANKLASPCWKALRRLTRGFDSTIVAGDWLKDRLEEFGIGNARCVPFGIDKERFGQEHNDPAFRQHILQKAGAPPNARLLVICGRLVPEKRIRTLVAAFERIQSHTPCALLALGAGPQKAWLDKQAQRIPGIWAAGHLEERGDVAKALASADALLHGSAAETYGLAVAEALASGTPAIVPNRGGAAALADPSCSESYDPGDVDGAVQATLNLFDRNLSTLRQNALKRSDSWILTSNQHFDRLFSHYQSLVNGAPD